MLAFSNEGILDFLGSNPGPKGLAVHHLPLRQTSKDPIQPRLNPKPYTLKGRAGLELCMHFLTGVHNLLICF